ncbi:hypothetical protein PHJA_001407800 [Phtheirospermum japonicum]|uniref:Uncharacterized protein n=1 Tax=Phtheirospermum japonicum TaxID=374723 RepID=A0A830C0I8_9LAMI|nr:hypothetical protein PHJA_001407800 [Phtheirospermum japonicum]
MIPDLCMDNVKTTTCSSIPTSPVGLRKASSVKRNNCLCSPTTHAGSFRCRHHRNPPSGGGMMRSSMSVGSKLSELGDKPAAMCKSIRHNPFITTHDQPNRSSTFLPA